MFEVQKLFYNSTIHPEAGHAEFLFALKQIGVDIRDYPEHKMWLLDYNQIEAVKNHPVVNDCRGILMGYDGSIVRKGFTRFYNLGENGVDQFDFENSVVFEKADGSLCFIYHCGPTGRWEIGTRGTAFAEGPNEWHGTFRNFMLAAMGRTEDQFQVDCEEAFHKHKTYLFEAIGPDNRIVTKYEFNQLVFLSIVDNITGEEDLSSSIHPGLFYDVMPDWNMRMIRDYKFNTQEDCIEALHALTGLQEGYVAYNLKTKLRVKIKSPTYLAAHRLRGNNGLTVNSICELVVMNEQHEYLAVFPEDAHKFNGAVDLWESMQNTLESDYSAYRDIESQKEFALAVKDLPMSAVMFNARKKGAEAIHELHQMPTSRKAEWLKSEMNFEFVSSLAQAV